MMKPVEFSAWAFFGVLEAAIVLFIVALFFVFRSRFLAQQIAVLKQKIADLSKAVPEPGQHGFEQYLRDEILRNEEMLERNGSDELLQLRKQFLENELQARAQESNPVVFEQGLVTGIRALVEQWRPEAAVVVETGPVAEDTFGAPDIEISDDAERETIDTTSEEFDRLKQVINNQQDAMSALREELQQREHEIQDVDSVLQKLDEFERQSSELHSCMHVLEQENERLKSARDAGALPDAAASSSGVQLNGLKAMVNDQQDTITRLHSLISDITPDANKAQELEEAVDNVRRTNHELSGCVSVLEDENELLRGELEQIRSQLEQQVVAGPAEAAADDSPLPADLSESSDAGQEPDARVQELEALVEFKDAALEELEKQYNALEARYLTLTGEQQTG